MDVPTPTPADNIGLKTQGNASDVQPPPHPTTFRKAMKAHKAANASGRAAAKAIKAKTKELPLSEKKFLLEYFGELFCGRKYYKWQKDVLRDIGVRGSFTALVAANGSGKTSCVISDAVLWHMIRFPGSRTVCTAGVYRQVVDALWPSMKLKAQGMGGSEVGWTFTEDHIRFLTPDESQHHWGPSTCVGFAATDGEKAEGHHAAGRDENLLFVIDEAKSVMDDIFKAMERCQPTRVLVASSPGGTSGAFYDICNKPDPRYKIHRVTAYDCPHITKEWIDQQIAIYGEKSALIKSMIFAEFGEEDGQVMVLPNSVLQKTINSPPVKEGSKLYAGCDFAAGGDENVICIREGNDVKQMIHWREKDTTTAIGRFITEFVRAGLKPEDIYADGGGIGINFCDALREAGWPVNRVNNGDAALNNLHYANRGTEMWTAFARLVETGRVRVPADDILHRQLTTRLLLHNSKGKQMVEPKEKMKERGLGSPDRADALILAFCGMGQSLETYMLNQGRGFSFSDIYELADDKVIDGAFCG